MAEKENSNLIFVAENNQQRGRKVAYKYSLEKQDDSWLDETHMHVE